VDREEQDSGIGTKRGLDRSQLRELKSKKCAEIDAL
jgi:hypothetical protein